MAVKFSQFTPETVASTITGLVGYKSAGSVNLQIPAANLDTVYTTATTQAVNDVNFVLTGTKAGIADTTKTTVFTAGANVQLTAGTDAMTIASTNTTYDLDSLQTGDDVSITLAGSDSTQDTITLKPGGNITLTDDGSNNITIAATINPGDITGVSASAPLTGGGTSGDVTVGIQQSSGVQDGYLSSTDWNTFNNKSDTGGTVTSVGTSTTSLTALTLSGTVTTSGTLELAKTGGTAGQYIDGATGAWTNLPASGETYDLNSTTDGANVDLNLTSTSGTDNSSVKLVPAGGITISQVGNVVTLDTSASGTGTVTSVELTMPSAFAVSGSPVTTSGTLAVTSTGGSAGQYLDYTGAWSTPPSGAPTKTVDTATIANATTGTFTLSVSPSSENYVDMFISGVYQSKTTYTVSGTTVTLDGGTFFPNGAVVETVTTT